MFKKPFYLADKDEFDGELKVKLSAMSNGASIRDWFIKFDFYQLLMIPKNIRPGEIKATSIELEWKAVPFNNVQYEVCYSAMDRKSRKSNLFLPTCRKRSEEHASFWGLAVLVICWLLLLVGGCCLLSKFVFQIL